MVREDRGRGGRDGERDSAALSIVYLWHLLFGDPRTRKLTRGARVVPRTLALGAWRRGSSPRSPTIH